MTRPQNSITNGSGYEPSEEHISIEDEEQKKIVAQPESRTMSVDKSQLESSYEQINEVQMKTPPKERDLIKNKRKTQQRTMFLNRNDKVVDSIQYSTEKVSRSSSKPLDAPKIE